MLVVTGPGRRNQRIDTCLDVITGDRRSDRHGGLCREERLYGAGYVVCHGWTAAASRVRPIVTSVEFEW